MSDTDLSPKWAASQREYRQVGLVCLLALGLVLGAFVAPPGLDFEPQTAAPDGSSGGAGGGSSGGVGDGTPTSGSTTPTPAERVAIEDSHCELSVDGEPIPGTTIRISLQGPSGPLSDVPIWISGERVGTTDRTGTIEASVPYTDSIEIVAGLDDYPECNPTENTVAAPPLPTVAAVQPALAASTQATQNESRDIPTVGDMAIDAPAEAYPGETVTVRATIEDVPVPEATVTVDGRDVAETADDGTATVTLPEETHEATVSVSRGAFRSDATIDLKLLSVSFTEDSGRVLPGQSATIEAKEGDELAAGAVVEVDGEQVTTTDSDGRATVALPRNPIAPVTVSTDTQSGSVTILEHHLSSVTLIIIFLLALALVTAIVYRFSGRRGVAILYGGGVLVGGTTAVFYVGNPLSLVTRLHAIGAGVVLLFAGIVVWLARHDRSQTDRPLLARLREWLTRVLLGIVRRLERAISWVRRLGFRFTRWLRSQPRSLRLLVGRFWDWLRGVMAMVGDFIGRLGWKHIVITLAGVVAIGGGYLVAGQSGAAIGGLTVLGLGVFVIGYGLLQQQSSKSPVKTESKPVQASATVPSQSTESELPDSIPQLWRQFAKRVASGQWETQTPKEIAMNAIDQGYPSNAVDGLTTLFCDIEYGGRSPTSDLTDRAQSAYRRLDDDTDDDTDDDDEPGGEAK